MTALFIFIVIGTKVKAKTPANFNQLRQLVQQNNDLLQAIREHLATPFPEIYLLLSAALDFQYSKALKKISANLHRATQQADW
ncbi:hypothetical protein DICVIV_08750 [Dictyocaulus viviparus]|uniref:Uncharacterized protein n=1 Tax=Dictyocaulus viviparus TaxID=29172 RepID=A0A0D8XN52_DICVI|nr:hypothetical protein DICVIV_08750 [Dictyocaulus viviparus]